MRGQRQWYMVQNPHGLRAHNCTGSCFKHIEVQWILHSSERVNVHQSWNHVSHGGMHGATWDHIFVFCHTLCGRLLWSFCGFYVDIFSLLKVLFQITVQIQCNTTTAHTHRPTYATRKLVFCFWMYQTGTFIQIQEVMWHQWLELFCFFFPFFSYNADRRTM